MGAGEAGAGACERCGQVGPIRKTGGFMYLCHRCRQVYETELLRKQASEQKTQTPPQQTQEGGAE